jgi:hypothetical protein
MMFNNNNDDDLVYQSCGVADNFSQPFFSNDSLLTTCDVSKSAFNFQSFGKLEITEMVPYFDSKFSIKANTINFPHDTATTITFLSEFLRLNNIYFTCNHNTGLFQCQILYNNSILHMNIQLFECDDNNKTMVELFRLSGDSGFFCHILKGLKNIIDSAGSGSGSVNIILAPYADTSFDLISSILNQSKAESAVHADCNNNSDELDDVMNEENTGMSSYLYISCCYVYIANILYYYYCCYSRCYR